MGTFILTFIRGTDGIKGNISAQSKGIKSSEEVDINIPGSYPLKISFNDPNNIYGEAEKTVNVNVIAKPTINAPVLEDSLVNQTVLISNVNVIDSGNLGTGTVSSINVKDENGDSMSVQSDGTIKPDKAGLYTITYTYNYTKPNGDSDSVEATRTLKVHPEAVLGADVTVKYVDTDGNQISEDIVKSGNVGDGYTTGSKVIDGYTFKEVQGNVSGNFTNQAQTVTYIYKKNYVTPSPKLDENSATPESSKYNNKTITASKNKNTLPQTGDDERLSRIVMISGLLLILGTVSVMIFRHKKID